MRPSVLRRRSFGAGFEEVESFWGRTHAEACCRGLSTRDAHSCPDHGWRRVDLAYEWVAVAQSWASISLSAPKSVSTNLPPVPLTF